MQDEIKSITASPEDESQSFRRASHQPNIQVGLENIHSDTAGFPSARAAFDHAKARLEMLGKNQQPAVDANQDNFDSDLLARTIKEHGPLFFKDTEWGWTLGVGTIANYFVNLLNLQYSQRANIFTMCSKGGQRQIVSKATLSAMIRTWMGQQADLKEMEKVPNDNFVSGQLKPASDGQFKTGHLK